jgi:hypothetical protein
MSRSASTGRIERPQRVNGYDLDGSLFMRQGPVKVVGSVSVVVRSRGHIESSSERSRRCVLGEVLSP